MFFSFVFIIGTVDKFTNIAIENFYKEQYYIYCNVLKILKIVKDV